MNALAWDRATSRRMIRWTACLLAIMLGVNGCGAADDGKSSNSNTDSVDVTPPDDTGTMPGLSPAPEVVLRNTLERTLRGDADPASEHSWFTSATAGALRSVSIDSVGHAIVDFADLRTLIPNASSSAGSEMLLAELNTTVFSVTAIRSVDYLIEGRCDLFWEWLQRSCQTVRRPMEGSPASSSDASGEGVP